MKRPADPAAVQSILDCLEFLTAEALRCRRVDIATALIEALHRIDGLETKVPAVGKRTSPDVYAA